ncbi:MAG: hypothetical protein ACI30R_02420 [Sodaliphilus sp.]
MNKIKLFALVLSLVGALSMQAALNPTEQKIVGKYKTQEVISTDEDGVITDIIIEGTFDWNAQNAGSVKVDVMGKININNAEYSNTFSFRTTMNGDLSWHATDSTLSVNIGELKTSPMKLFAEKNDELSAIIVPAMEKEINKNLENGLNIPREWSSTIVDIQPDKIILEEEEGKKKEYVRVKESL